MIRKFSYPRFIGLAICALGVPFFLGLARDPFWIATTWVAVLALAAFATGWRLTAAAAPAKSCAVALAFIYGSRRRAHLSCRAPDRLARFVRKSRNNYAPEVAGSSAQWQSWSKPPLVSSWPLMLVEPLLPNPLVSS
jgi:hypothetical protein